MPLLGVKPKARGTLPGRYEDEEIEIWFVPLSPIKPNKIFSRCNIKDEDDSPFITAEYSSHKNEYPYGRSEVNVRADYTYHYSIWMRDPNGICRKFDKEVKWSTGYLKIYEKDRYRPNKKYWWLQLITGIPLVWEREPFDYDSTNFPGIEPDDAESIFNGDLSMLPKEIDPSQLETGQHRFDWDIPISGNLVIQTGPIALDGKRRDDKIPEDDEQVPEFEDTPYSDTDVSPSDSSSGVYGETKSAVIPAVFNRDEDKDLSNGFWVRLKGGGEIRIQKDTYLTDEQISRFASTISKITTTGTITQYNRIVGFKFRGEYYGFDSPNSLRIPERSDIQIITEEYFIE